MIGLSAALSMGASEFLSEREDGDKNPLIAALFTGGAYLVVAILLVLPYFIFIDQITAFWVMVVVAFAVVLAYSWYVSVNKEGTFWSRASVMIGVCIFVAGLSFLFASGFQIATGIEI